MASSERPSLTKDQIVDRLRLFSWSVVDTVYDLALRGIDGEERRHAGLTSKAGSLLAAAGVSVTVTFAVGGLLVEKFGFLSTWSPFWWGTLLVGYASALLVGLRATWAALGVLRVRGDYEVVSEHEVFSELELGEANSYILPFPAEYVPATPERPAEYDFKGARAKEHDSALRGDQERMAGARYRRFLIPHLWGIQRTHHAIHERKAKALRGAESLFFWALCTQGLVGILLTVILVVRFLEPPGDSERTQKGLTVTTSTASTGADSNACWDVRDGRPSPTPPAAGSGESLRTP